MNAFRRALPRVSSPRISAIVRTPDGQTTSFAVENLSLGGAVVRARAAALAVGDPVRVMLRAEKDLMYVVARVARIDPDERSTRVALHFLEMPTQLLEQLRVLVHDTIEAQRRECPNLILIIGARHDAASELERDLAEQGYSSRSVQTPLETIWQLADQSRRYTTALVDFDRDPAAALDILFHLIVSHRHIRRVLLSTQEPEVLARETSSWRAHACLRIPWTRAALAAAVSPPLV